MTFLRTGSSAVLFLLAACLPVKLSAQVSGDNILFKAGSQEVTVDEFRYIYEKTSTGQADYSEASLREYLELYINFKLKVNRAYELGLDTLPGLVNELESYRRQLAGAYLMDKAVAESMVDEAFERFRYDVDISHIFISLPEGHAVGDTMEAYEKIHEIYAQLDQYSSFAEAAIKHSDDAGTAQYGGRIGYITAMLYPGIYNLETAAYNTPVGSYSAPVRTYMGYHIVKVNNKRPAWGEREIAHIFIRIRENDEAGSETARARAMEAYTLLEQGTSFDLVARDFSDDRETAARGGFLGKITVNQFDSIFEAQAFSLSQPGDFTHPFRSRTGYHIVSLLHDLGIPNKERDYQQVLNRIKRDERFQIAQQALLKQIKEDSDFTKNRQTFEALVQSLDASFFERSWEPGEKLSGLPWITLGNKAYTLDHFTDYLKEQSATRMRRSRNTSPAELVYQMYNTYEQSLLLAWEEDNLENKFPEFKSLMREYREGILLFEATRREVWEPGMQDTSGLEAFFAAHRDRYIWEERAVIRLFRVNTANPEFAAEIRDAAERLSDEDLLTQFNKDVELVTPIVRTLEKSRFDFYPEVQWEEGYLSALHIENNRQQFFRIEELRPAGLRTLDEARGYVMADFQDSLEKAWVKSLHENYSITVNGEIFDSLIQ